MERFAVVGLVVILATGAFGQDACSSSPCANTDTCHLRNSPEGYVCQCTIPNRSGYDCNTPSDSQEVFTCYGTDCRTGNFSSNNYPNIYPNRYRALYLIYVPGANGFTFTFDSPFAIEMNKDELYVGAGLNVDFQAIQTDMVNENGDVFFFQGDQAPAPFTVTGTDTIWMYFLTDKNIPQQGFRVRWVVRDNSPPLITGCPGNLDLTTTNPNGDTVTWTPPQATDVNMFSTSATHQPGQFFSLGTTQVTYTFTDTLALSSTCVFTVTQTFLDIIPPVVTCPENIAFEVPFGANGRQVTWQQPTVTDNSGNFFFVSSSNNPNDFFSPGSTIVTYTYRDNSNNQNSCSFTVLITAAVDNIPPVVTCPDNIAFEVPFGGTGRQVTWQQPTVSDNSGNFFFVSSTNNPNDFFSVGSTIVTYTYRDNSNNQNSCSFTVLITAAVDNIPPVVTCPDNIGFELPFGANGRQVTWQQPTVTDNSGNFFFVSSSNNPNDFFSVGSTIVTYTYRDNSNNQNSCSFTVLITAAVDITPPVVTCPDNIAFEVPFGANGRQVTWQLPTVTDNSGNFFFVTSTNNPNDFFNVGSNLVTYTYRDAANNVNICSFTVLITTAVDNIPPVVTCPDNIAFEVPFGGTGRQVTWQQPTVTDNSGNFFFVSSSNNPNDFFSVGSNIVTYTYRDAASNQNSCSFTVLITAAVDNIPPVVTCPDNIAFEVPFGGTGRQVTWQLPTVTDNSGNFFFVSSSNNPNDFFSVGSNIVTYTYRDAASNQNSCSFTVLITAAVDNIPPVVTCPDNIAFEVPFGGTGRQVTWQLPTVSDNSGNFFFVSSSNNPNDFFSVGSNLVTYTYSDDAGNRNSCSFTVLITAAVDNIPPVVTCPDNIAFEVPFGATGRLVTWQQPTVSDNSGNFFFVSSSNNPNDFFSVGSTIVTYTYRDNSNNQNSCSFTVLITAAVDNIPPVVTCPDNIAFEVPFGGTGRQVTWQLPTVTDNSGNFFFVSSSNNPNDFFSVGSNIVTYTYRDNSNNQNSCSFTVLITAAVDNIPPVVTCPDNIAFEVPFGATGRQVTWQLPTVSDNSGNFFFVSSSNNPNDFFSVRSNLVTYTYSDDAGNRNSCSFTVLITAAVDNIPPVVACPDNIAFEVPFGANGRQVTWQQPTVTDNSGNFFFVSSSNNPNDFFSVGSTIVTYTYRDNSNNQNSCSFTVLITAAVDNIPPVVTCPDNIAFEVPFGGTGRQVTWQLPTVSDNSGNFFFVSSSNNPNDFFSVGSNLVTYTYSDDAGNRNSCSFTVLITAAVDNIPPVVTCPDNIAFEVPFGATGRLVTWQQPTVTDNSGNFFFVSSSNNPNDFFSVGSTIVTYTYRDNSNNQNSCSFTVLITAAVDNIPPVVTCPDNIAFEVPFGGTGRQVTWQLPTVSDNSGNFFFVSSSNNPNDFFSVGSNSVTYTYSDDAGNRNSCSFTVLITAAVDNIPPVVACPDNIAFEVPFGANGRQVTWQQPTVTDNSGNFFFVSSSNNPNDFFSVGSTIVTYTYRDNSNNQNSCSFTVLITAAVDNIPPVVTCPDNIAFEVPFGGTGRQVTWQLPTVSDNSGNFFFVSSSNNPNDFFSVGSNSVTYTYSDDAGNRNSCSFTVLITAAVDNIPPVVTCPDNIAFEVPFGATGRLVTWQQPTVSDNSGNFFFVSSSNNPNDFFSVGSTIVTYTYRDNSNNQNSCSFTVLITAAVDNIPPVVTCPDNIAFEVPFGGTGRQVTWQLPTVSDNSGNFFFVSSSNNPNDFFSVGSNLVTYTYSDDAGNRNSCSFTVLITAAVDNIPPVVTCPDNINFEVPFGGTGRQVTWQLPTVTDNSGNFFFVSSTNNPNDFFSVGSNIVTYTYRDNSNNQNSCSFTVLITAAVDNIPPVVTCPDNIAFEVPFGGTGRQVTWQLPTVSDNSGNFFFVSSSNNPNDFFSVGSNSVTYTYSDDAGNRNSCSFTVLITAAVDNIPPVVTCPDNIAFEVPFGATGRQVTWQLPTVSDNSGNFFFVSSSNNPNDFFSVRSNLVTYTYSDDAGNRNSCSFTVLITAAVDNIPPVVACPDNIAFEVPFGANGRQVTWQQPTVTDNSGNFFFVSSSNNPNDFFSVGSTIVTYTYRDNSNNQNSCSFTVLITAAVDNIPPVVTCPDNIAFEVPFGGTGRQVTWQLPTVSDNSGNFFFVSSSNNPNDFFSVGSNSVTYTYSDDAGNRNSCSFTVLITAAVDNIPPVVTCPDNIAFEVPFGATGRLVTWQQPTVTDNSGNFFFVSSSNNPNDFFSVGSNIVTYTYRDNSNNQNSCSFTVLITAAVDNIPPVVTCPDNIAFEVPFGANGRQVTWQLPTVTDNSGNFFFVSSSNNPNDFFSVRSNLVTYTYSDDAGNRNSCSFTVLITAEVDNIPPVVTCPDNIAFEVPFGANGRQVTWQQPTVSDNSGNFFFVSSTNNPNDFFSVGSNIVTYTYRDAASNQNSCSFTVLITAAVDNIPPVVTCPDNIAFEVPFGANGRQVTWQLPTVTDNSGNFFFVSSSNNPNDFFSVRSNLVTYTYSDDAGNRNSCSFTVLITAEVDNIPPVVTCPDNIAFEVPFGGTGRQVTWQQPTVSDNSGNFFFVSSTNNPNDFFSVGSNIVTYTYRDAASNQNSCSFTVLITAAVDNIPPVVTCPDNINFEVPFGGTGRQVTWQQPTVSDNSGNFFFVSSTNNPNDFFSVGSNIVTYTYSDDAGNRNSCSFTVLITAEVDNIPPVVTCPDNIAFEVPFGGTGRQVTWQQPTVSDNSGNFFFVSSTNNPNDFFSVGSNIVTYTYRDAASNQNSCSFTVLITAAVDNIPPVVTCPDNINFEVPFGGTGRQVTWQQPTVSDNSGNFFFVSSTNNPNDFFSVGSNIVTYTYRDAASNQNSCSFTVLITAEVDNIPPVVTCPDNIAFEVPFGGTGRQVTWQQPTVSDNSGNFFFVSSTNNPNDFFSVGSNIVTYTYRDAASNQNSCSFTVLITAAVDNIPPVVTCPDNINFEVPFGGTGRQVTWQQPTVSDNSGNFFFVSSTNNPNDFFSVGSTIVTYTYRDAASNQNSCSFTVLITAAVDNIPPVVTCPDNINFEVPFGGTGRQVTWQQPTVSDNSGNFFFVSSTNNPNDFFSVGSNIVTYTYRDNSNNQNSCSFTVLITAAVDNVDPVITCPPDINQQVTSGSENGAQIRWAMPTATDNTGIPPVVTLSSDPSQIPNSLFIFGSHNISYTATDLAGNQAMCTFTITVVDRISPIVNCPADLTFTIPLGTSGRTVSWSLPTVTDNAGVYTHVSSTHNPNDFFRVGSTRVTYTYQDASNNVASCNFNIVINQVDVTPPYLVTCPADIMINLPGGDAPVRVDFDVPTAQDNSGTATLVSNNFSPNDLFPLGRTVVMYRFADAAGNSVTCSFAVEVNEVSNPCLSQPCRNGGACVPITTTSYQCVCPSCYSGDFCQLAADACQNNGCLNGANCVAFPGSCTQYQCECSNCFFGRFCENNVDNCENNQCSNGAVCATNTDCTLYTCHCPPCFTGQFCTVPVTSCLTSNCMNGGVCQQTSLNPFSCNEYTCTCTGCFTGQWCEQPRQACNPNPCNNGGLCTNVQNNCLAYTCMCVGCFTGFNCEIPITNPCQQNPCQNGGNCQNEVGNCASYSCQCPLTHTGVNCELTITVNPNPCNSFPCLNGATCLTMDGTHYICMCINGFVGLNCETPSVNLPQLERCTNSQCNNGGTCYNSYNSKSGQNVQSGQYSCVCAQGFTGINCNIATVSQPSLDICSITTRPACEQGARCLNDYHSYDADVDYFCDCPVGYIGHNCETSSINPCTSGPCQNGGQCSGFNTYFTCQCTSEFTGPTCEMPFGDTTSPVITGCPTSVTRNVSPGTTMTIVTWVPPQSTDNSGTSTLAFVTNQPNTLFPVGVTAVSYLFQDPSNNYAVCAFYVTVTSGSGDNLPPVVNNCPVQGVVQTAPQGTTSAVVTWNEPSATDNSGGFVQRSSNRSPGQNFPLGVTEITYTFTDPSGNQAFCRFTVTVTSVGDSVPPVVSGCPTEDVTGTVLQGASTAVVSWTAPTATDNSGGFVSVVSNRSPGQSFNIGMTAIQYTFTDPSGNPAFCRFTVTVSSGGDTTPPVVTGCPTQGVTAVAQQGATSATVNWSVPRATDNSGGFVAVTSNRSPGQMFSLGMTQVEYVFTDLSGNQAFCRFAVVVIAAGGDTTPPVISGCPSSASAVAPQGSTTATVTWNEPTATDNSGGNVLRTSTHFPGQSYQVGMTMITYTFTDPSGNQAFCNFVVTVSTSSGGDQPPVITGCPTGVTGVLSPGMNTGTATWTPPQATDDDGLPVSVGFTAAPGQPFSIGQTEVRYFFADSTGNVATCMFFVTITDGSGGDTIPPVISGCPQSATGVVPQGSTSVSVTWVEPTATDNSGGPVQRTSDRSPGQTFGLGSTQVTYTFTDQSGNQAFCQFTVTVTSGGGGDTIPPVISGCPPGASAVAPQGQTSAVVTWNEPTATDNSGGNVQRSSNRSPGESFSVGMTMITYTFTDQSGNQATCTFAVTVSTGSGGNQPPVITGCPQGVTGVLTPGMNTGTATWTPPQATDDDGLPVSEGSTAAPGQSFPLGQTEVRYFFGDSTGNVATCIFFVTITGGSGGDTIPPVISGCPSGATAVAPQGQTSASVTWNEPTATDNSGGNVQRSSNRSPGQTFGLGSTQVTYTFTDPSGNQATCRFTVTVTSGGSGGDTIPPVISGCPSGATGVASQGSNVATVTWVEPTATDNSGGNVQRSSDRSPGQSFGLGSTQVTYTFTDPSGNQATCRFIVNVISGGDTIPPVISGCPSGASAVAPQGQTLATVTWNEPTATDNSGGNVQRSSNRSPGQTFGLGSTQVTYTFTDPSGNQATCRFTVTVTSGGSGGDTIPPVISGCPSGATGVASQGSNVATVTWVEPTATDNSGGNVQRSSDRSPGQSFGLGSTQVTYTFTDPSGNQATCRFIVNVISGGDTIPPVISGCPSGASAVAPQGQTLATVTWNEPTATDNSGGNVQRSSNRSPGQTFGLGSTQVTYTFTDPSGNQAICQFPVTVTSGSGGDTTPPVITNCPLTVSGVTDPGLNTGKASWTEPQATDNSGLPVRVARSHFPESTFPLGQTEVQYIFTDTSDNQAICAFTVTITGGSGGDNIPPVISGCPSGATGVASQGSNIATVTWVEPTATDNSGGNVQRSSNRSPGQTFGLGSTQVTYTFTDPSGNQATCRFTVTVTAAVQGPSISCPASVTGFTRSNNQRVELSWTAPTVSGGSGQTSVTANPNSYPAYTGMFSVGSTSIVYTVTDALGNQNTCTVRLNVILDNQPPTYTGCPGGRTAVLPTGSSTVVVTWTEPIAQDNNGVARTDQTHQPGSSFSAGLSTVMYTFTDVAGNQAVCEFTVTVTTSVTPTPCSSNPCAPPLSCFFTADSYICIDQSAGRRKRDTGIDDVEDVEYCPCENGGLCVKSSSDVNSFYCVCPHGFNGILCADVIADVSVCDPNPCGNNGTCNPHLNNKIGFECICKPGWKGMHCLERGDQMSQHDMQEYTDGHNILTWSLVAFASALCTVIIMMAALFCRLLAPRLGNRKLRNDEITIVH
ncbi:uncharacterized protein LOC117289582 isoform X15 [Asterias rubens]|uniref:uncharacterized protein LOC117289582 isoform X15 n=1 Tax=Asterias rubens TaxID=7604 RepID=UPI001454F3F4|nr:uncharacterized protein LOC117289582 isoform X15 [Asterias rubens]